MKTVPLAILSISLAYASAANAVLLSGFEDELAGWESIGDVSIQGSAIGDPSQGTKQVFITTMCDGRVVRWCNGDGSHPFSGNSSLPTDAHGGFPTAAEFFDMPSGESEFEAMLPSPPANGAEGETGGIKTRFFATAGTQLLFDWRHYAQVIDGTGPEGDSSWFTIWNADDGSTFRFVDYLRNYTDIDFPFASSLALCARDPDIACNRSITYETGYRTYSMFLPTAGWYWLGFGMLETAEGTAASALSIDNVRLIPLRVPEPGTLGLLCLGVLALAVMRLRIGGRPSHRNTSAAVAAMLFVMSGEATATPINDGLPPFSNGWLFNNQLYPYFIGGGSSWTYDAETGVLNLSRFQDGWSGPFAPHSTPSGSDFDARLNLHAVIDQQTGNLVDGVVTWTGSIPELGIGPDSLLMFGDVTAISLSSDSFLQFVIKPRFTNPLWGLDFGPRMWLLLGSGDIDCCNDDGTLLRPDQIWTFDHDRTPFTADTFYFGIPVPEPSMFALMMLSLVVGFSFTMKTHRGRAPASRAG